MMESVAKKTKLEELFDKAEFNRFGINSVILITVGSLGGIAIGLGGIENIVSLCIVVFPTMITLSMIIGLTAMRTLIWTAFFTVIIDLILIAYYAFSSLM